MRCEGWHFGPPAAIRPRSFRDRAVNGRLPCHRDRVEPLEAGDTGLQRILSASIGLPEITADDGDVVITEGTPQDRLLVLVSGTVEVTRDGFLVATIADPGAIFGETAALLGGPATASVRCLGDCRFRVCDDPREFLRVEPDIALAIASVLARRLDRLNRYLVDIREQYADRDDHLRVVDVVLESLAHHQGVEPQSGSDREQEAPY
jgi:CRP-like cAMP-binding protein